MESHILTLYSWSVWMWYSENMISNLVIAALELRCAVIIISWDCYRSVPALADYLLWVWPFCEGLVVYVCPRTNQTAQQSSETTPHLYVFTLQYIHINKDLDVIYWQLSYLLKIWNFIKLLVYLFICKDIGLFYVISQILLLCSGNC